MVFRDCHKRQELQSYQISIRLHLQPRVQGLKVKVVSSAGVRIMLKLKMTQYNSS